MNVKGAIAVAIVALTLFAVVAGFRLVGSPDHRRSVDADNRQIAEMKSIVNSVKPAKTAPSALPPHVPRSYYSGREGYDTGPISTGRFSYRKVDAYRFNLCATFLADSSDGDAEPGYPHGIGRTCYRYDVRVDDLAAPQHVTPAGVELR